MKIRIELLDGRQGIFDTDDADVEANHPAKYINKNVILEMHYFNRFGDTQYAEGEISHVLADQPTMAELVGNDHGDSITKLAQVAEAHCMKIDQDWMAGIVYYTFDDGSQVIIDNEGETFRTEDK